MSHDLFSVEPDDRATIIRLSLPRSIDSERFDELNEAMLSMIADAGSETWIIDLTEVHYMGSAMLGLMVNMRQRIKLANGKLVLCSMPPTLLQIFRTCSMERLFVIARSREEALSRTG